MPHSVKIIEFFCQLVKSYVKIIWVSRIHRISKIAIFVISALKMATNQPNSWLAEKWLNFYTVKFIRKETYGSNDIWDVRYTGTGCSSQVQNFTSRRHVNFVNAAQNCGRQFRSEWVPNTVFNFSCKKNLFIVCICVNCREYFSWNESCTIKEVQCENWKNSVKFKKVTLSQCGKDVKTQKHDMFLRKNQHWTFFRQINDFTNNFKWK